jgi:hypothetical protein
MLGDAGSIASLAGVVISLVGLGFAIWHILRLRGEARAAREAAEETHLAVSRETAGMTLTRVSERIEALKELHRQNEWDRALDRYPELRRMLIDVGARHPEMSDAQRTALRGIVTMMEAMETGVENARSRVSRQLVQEFNRQLSESQSLLAEIESEL